MPKAIEQMNEAIEDFLENAGNKASKEEVQEHIGDTGNPHSVTKEQIGLSEVDNVKQAAKSAFIEHVGAINPHDVTKDEVGLSEVDNVRQAPLTSYNAHIAGNADKHSGEDIIYSEGKSVTDKINELLIDGGAGTMYHNELLNRNLSGAHSVESITGLRGELGKTLIFTGTTNGSEEIYLRCAETDSEFIDAKGNLTIGKGKAAMFELSVIGIYIRDDEGNISPMLGGMWYKKGLLARYGVMVATRDDEMTAYRLNSGENAETETTASLGLSDSTPNYSARGIKVHGGRVMNDNTNVLEDVEMYWRAEVRLTNIFDASVFSEE